jgi:hypothetical protein
VATSPCHCAVSLPPLKSYNVDREKERTFRTELLHVRAHGSRDSAKAARSTPVEPPICNYLPLCGNRRLSQFVEQRLGLFEVSGIEPLGKPAEDRGEQGDRFSERRRGVRFATDSALEGDGFELPVPVRQAKLTRSCR